MWNRFHISMAYCFEMSEYMATISDVAKYANVSVSTVSRYLNGKGYVGEKSRKAIEHAIQDLNYVPNEVARSLSTRQSDLIGLIIPDIKNPFFPELARAVEDTAFKYGYTVILCNSDEQLEKERHYMQALTKKYVAGIIITSLFQYESNPISNIPVVALDRPINMDIPTVTTNNIEGAKIGANHLIDCGATKLLYMKGPVNITSSEERLEGYLQAIQGKGIESHLIESPFEFDAAEAIAFEYLQKNPSINGIFASSDASAIGAMKAALRLNKKVPEDLQIVGFDGIQIGNVVTPTLTTVAQNIYELGETATEMLIQQIEGKTLPCTSVHINPQLIERDTTKKEHKR